MNTMFNVLFTGCLCVCLLGFWSIPGCENIQFTPPQEPSQTPIEPPQEKSEMTEQTNEEQIPKTDAQWKKALTKEQYYVLRRKGTERPFTGKYDKFYKPGVYKCAGCGELLFTSDSKYNSGCGWPAFSIPADRKAVKESRDTSHGMIRTEITCSNCGGHLGHVFDDGPAPTGLRYCINSAALEFEEEDKVAEK